ncbi:hypothetical protein OROHE_015144 [Orobanche hederae]
MGKKQHLDWTSKSIISSGSEEVSFLNKQGRRKTNEDRSGENEEVETGLEQGDNRLDVYRLVIATIALLVASTSSLLIPNFGGMIIDMVSRNIITPKEQAQALEDVKNTILAIISIVVIGSLSTEIALFDVSRMSELLSRLSEDNQVIKSAATMNISEALRNVTTVQRPHWHRLHVLIVVETNTLLALVVVSVISVASRRFGHYLHELLHATQAAVVVAASIAKEHSCAAAHLQLCRGTPPAVPRHTGNDQKYWMKLGAVPRHT